MVSYHECLLGFGPNDTGRSLCFTKDKAGARKIGLVCWLDFYLTRVTKYVTHSRMTAPQRTPFSFSVLSQFSVPNTHWDYRMTLWGDVWVPPTTGVYEMAEKPHRHNLFQPQTHSHNTATSRGESRPSESQSTTVPCPR
jgi:hypothetical protein